MNNQDPHNVTRRTVARGIAWTAPVVAVAVTAPAFALSPGPINPSSVKVCKCPGRSTDTDYGYALTFQLNYPPDGPVTVKPVVLNGNTMIVDKVTVSATQIVIIVHSTNSADGDGISSITYKHMGVSRTETFSFNGTPPCKNNECATD